MSMNAEEVQQESRIDDPDEISLANFEMVSGEFFAQIKEPIFTLNGRKSYVNTSCVRMMPNVDYVQILISIEEMKLVLLKSFQMMIQCLVALLKSRLLK